MKLAAVIICWNDWDLMDYCVESIQHLVDEVIIIGSTKSNFGEYSPIPKYYLDIGMGNRNVNLWIREPHFNIPMHSETDKRNYGLQTARLRGNTHILMMDSDEFYEKESFLKTKNRFLNEPSLAGLVCGCEVYFKLPTLSVGLDRTYVTFIHKITPTLKFEFNKKYPFAFDSDGIRIDPTRAYNIISGVEFTRDLIMHHYSYVRKDLDVKIRNSTARMNIEKSSLRDDYTNAKAGYYCKYYQKTLIECENKFNLSID